jgi:hypothetical protein
VEEKRQSHAFERTGVTCKGEGSWEEDLPALLECGSHEHVRSGGKATSACLPWILRVQRMEDGECWLRQATALVQRFHELPIIVQSLPWDCNSWVRVVSLPLNLESQRTGTTGLKREERVQLGTSQWDEFPRIRSCVGEDRNLRAKVVRHDNREILKWDETTGYVQSGESTQKTGRRLKC